MQGNAAFNEQVNNLNIAKKLIDLLLNKQIVCMLRLYDPKQLFIELGFVLIYVSWLVEVMESIQTVSVLLK